MRKTFCKSKAKYRFLKFFAFMVVALALFGTALMLLWNWLMPSIFGLTTIDFWQAIGLFVLARLLFSGKGFRRGGGSSEHRGFGRHADLKREKWMKMSFQERREWFKKRGFNRGFGFHTPHAFDSAFTKEENDTAGNE